MFVFVPRGYACLFVLLFVVAFLCCVCVSDCVLLSVVFDASFLLLLLCVVWSFCVCSVCVGVLLCVVRVCLFEV